MKGKAQFTQTEIARIRRLLTQKASATTDGQKSIRKQLRSLDFYISDFSGSNDGFDLDNFDRLIENGRITVSSAVASTSVASNRTVQRATSARENSDEAYILDLSDDILGLRCLRQHRFPFLTGDAGTRLPVDGYYRTLSLVIEYHERQHTESIRLFDQRDTASGVPRGIQRQIYDQRRREILPKHGIYLVELSFDEFSLRSNKQLVRDVEHDRQVLVKRLSKWMKS